MAKSYDLENHGEARLHFTQKLKKNHATNFIMLTNNRQEGSCTKKKNNSLGQSTKTSVYLHQSIHAKPYVSDAWDVLYVLLAGEKHGT